MEVKRKYCSCRLSAHNDSGRVRWCIGQDRKWQAKVKYLVFVPILLLSLVVVTIFLTRFALVINDVPSITLTELNNSNPLNASNNIFGPRTKRQIKTELQNSRKIQVFIKQKLFNYPGPAKIKRKLQRRMKRGLEELLQSLNFSSANVKLCDLKNMTTAIIISDNFSKIDFIIKPIKEEPVDKSEEATDEQLEEDLYIFNGQNDKIKHFKGFWDNKKKKTTIRKLQSKIMQQYMNPAIDPCEDFYEFSCGNWKKYFTIPPDRVTYDTFEIVREKLDYALWDLLDDRLEQTNPTLENHDYLTKIQNTEDPSHATVKAKNLFRSCMQEDILATRGDEPLRQVLEQLNGWPIITPNWSEENFDLVGVVAQLRLLNNDVLIAEWIGPDMKNSNEYIIHIDQTSLGLPARNYYLDPANFRYLSAYKSFILNVALLLGAEHEKAEQDVDELVRFEVQIAEIMATPEERRNISEIYLKTDIASLGVHFPEFDWNRYFGVLIEREVDRQKPVACYCAKYLQKLIVLLRNTPPRVIQNYLLWRFVRHRTNNLDQHFLDAKQRFYNVLFGREEQPPRWQFCVSQVNSNLGMPLGALYVKKYFSNISRADTIDMTEMLEEAFKETLTENTWLDDHTKNYARMKINQMDLKIGYPDFVVNQTELNKRYEDVEINPDNFFENIISLLRHITKTEQSRLGSEVNRNIWSTPPAVVNAYYSRNKNQIIFPAGMLQPPFYHQHFPKALNFGGIGVVIGHEITHGFDDKGRLFDHHGNLHLWWRDASIEKFYQKSQCMIDQYSQFVLPDIKMTLDGHLTQGENIADNGGLKQAFRAYETWLENNPDADEKLPDLNYTGRQLFFLNFAQVWCGEQRMEAAKSRIKTSVHAPGNFSSRVIGVLSNSEEFSRVFKCPKESPMNPEFKCTIW